MFRNIYIKCQEKSQEPQEEPEDQKSPVVEQERIESIKNI